jgi:tetratricopeptide (TPR) repeat protein
MPWRPILIAFAVAVAGAAAWVGIAAIDTRRMQGELRQAQTELDRGLVHSARRRLAAVSASRPRALHGEVDYWLGICEATAGRQQAALAAFGRVPPGFRYDARGAYLEAAASLQRGRLSAAESRLEQTLAGDELGTDSLRALLVRVYQIESRNADAALAQRGRLAGATDPAPILKDLWSIEREVPPLDSLGSTLDEAARMAPGDDRVWLGRGRLAIRAGQLGEAELWLKRCIESKADAPVWRSWLDWARAAGRPDEALRALKHIDPATVDPAERLAVRAWFASQAGLKEVEVKALVKLLEVEPHDTTALDRMAALAHDAGRGSAAAEYRRRKAEVDTALERYRFRLLRADLPSGPTAQLEMGQLAETAGRSLDAIVWYRAVGRSLPANASAQTALRRLTVPPKTLEATPDGWADLEPLVSARGRTPQSLAQTIPHFTDDAEAAGLRFQYDNGATPAHQLPEPLGGGLAILDYDQDGWPDIYCVQGGPFPPSPGNPGTGDRLFHNRGDGTFEDVTEQAGIGGLARGYGHGVTVGDYDGDGCPDLFVSRWRSYALYRNRGDGTFEDATSAAGLDGDRGWPTSAAFADLDGDGDLDLYVCHYCVWDADHPRPCPSEDGRANVSCNPLEVEAEADRLYRNDGGRFVEVSQAAGIVDPGGRGLGVVAADLDGDGRVDLFVANDMTANFLWRNMGGLRFEEVGHLAGVAGNAIGGYQAGMGVACGDLDGDGRIDLAVTNFYGEATTFYRNLGDGMFADETRAVRLDAASRHLLGFGLVLVDVNNDGHLDLASANGHVNDLRPHFPYQMPAQLLLGGPGGSLRDVSARAGSPWTVKRIGRGLAAGDLDGDGRIDLVLLGHGEPVAYFHNRGPGGRFVTLRLVARGANRDAIGAMVHLKVNGRQMVSARYGGGSYQSASHGVIHFGLGDTDRALAMEVRWPSGHVFSYEGIVADIAYMIREGDSVLHRESR